MISQQNKKAWSNPWALGMLGLILVVLSVNGIFIWYSAQNNRSTLVDRDYNTRDRTSDTEALREIQTRRALGWQTTVKQPRSIVVNQPAEYEISVVDRDGVPVSGKMEVDAYRAADASKDFATPFQEISPGTYRGAIAFPLKGFWELRIRLERGDEVFGVDTKRFSVAPAP